MEGRHDLAHLLQAGGQLTQVHEPLRRLIDELFEHPAMRTALAWLSAQSGPARGAAPGPRAAGPERCRMSSAIGRLPGRGPRLASRGPWLEASADSGEGLPILA